MVTMATWLSPQKLVSFMGGLGEVGVPSTPPGLSGEAGASAGEPAAWRGEEGVRE